MALDVRRLAAVDMYGGKGGVLRSRIILVEFLLGATVMPAAGVGVLVQSTGVTSLVFGLWLVGAGLNYVPLAVHAVSLSRRGALATELAGVDVRAALRYYTRAQLWVFVPLALVACGLRRWRAGASG